MIAKVLIDNLSVAGDKIYDYIIPENLIDDIEIGKRVLVYFGRVSNLIPALVIDIRDKSDYEESKLKKIKEILDDEIIVNQYLIDLIKYMRDNYFCTYVDALKCVLPNKMDEAIKKEIYDILDKDYDNPLYEDILSLIKKRNGKCSFNYLKEKLDLEKQELKKRLSFLVKNKIITRNVSYYIKEEKKDEIISLSGKFDTKEEYISKLRKNANKQIMIIEKLSHSNMLYETLIKETGANRSIITKLTQMNLIKSEFLKKEHELYLNSNEDSKNVVLNEEQSSVLNSYLNETQVNKFLLHGVTGSGKTEVYIKMFKNELKKGKQCLFLVPEIALTPQMMRNIYNRFNGQVAIIHSKLSDAKRVSEWDRIRKGEAKIILGARSALFAPIKNLGLIVIDEEHENTYKSSQTPRYDTIDLANYICSITKAKLVLGSATPSVESYYKAIKGEYKLLEMKKRANGKDFPKVEIVDMTDEMRSGNKLSLSVSLQKEIELRLKNKEQVILFMNRRGFSTYVFCRKCGYIEQCPNCDVSLTYHQNTSTLKCHYCGYEKKIPSICPECGSDKIKWAGTGTQKIETTVKKLFKDAKVLRMDFDTTRKMGSMEEILSQFRKNEADILIGTQMVVKGHDFPNVTLVGILLADTALNFPDINANQTAFQLCTQASGRAGRAEKEGKVIMQTYKPKNKTLVYSAMHDYKSFYAYDIAYRKNMMYPPFSQLLGIFVANESEEKSNKHINYVYNKIEKLIEEKNIKDVKLYKPTSAFIHKLKNKYIMHILLRYNIDSEIKVEIRNIFNDLKREMDSTIFAEINPATLL